MHKVFKTKNRKFNNYPYIIAEIGVNHEGSLTKAKKLIDLAKEGGANAVKFQTYKAENLASVNSPAYWDTNLEKTTSQFKLFKKYDKLNFKDYKILYKHCKKRNIDFSSTPFDKFSVDYLNPYLKFFKIASADINNLPLLKHIAKKRKPILLSTGASYLKEIKFAVKYLKKHGCPDVTILHCILNYPTNKNNANLNMIDDLRKNFPNNTIGYSDHTLPNKSMINLIIANLKGAVVIEKHFTDNKLKKGNDHYHSMDKEDLKNFFRNIDLTKILLGKNKKEPIKTEIISRKNARRSIVINKNILKGEKIKEETITTKRPGTGISPMQWKRVLGKKIKRNLFKDHILKWKDLK
tara:strand:+ start:923 stop:1975 length:1053 start_codon:yes stop_codon:yes gene_type:complete